MGRVMRSLETGSSGRDQRPGSGVGRHWNQSRGREARWTCLRCWREAIVRSRRSLRWKHEDVEVLAFVSMEN